LENGVEWFGSEMILTVVVGGGTPQTNGLSYVSHNLSANVATGAALNFIYNVTNSGTKPWGSNHLLALREFGYSIVQLAPLGTTASGSAKAVAFSFIAPSSPGTYRYRVQPLENGVEWFGAETILTLVVGAGSAPSAPGNALDYMAHDFPATVVAGESVSFSYAVKNPGKKSWASDHLLALRNLDYSIIQLAPLGLTGSGESKSVSFSFIAPEVPGTYRYRLQPLENGVEWFGEERILTLRVVSPRALKNAIDYGRHDFPSHAVPGATVRFSWQLTNSGSKSWGANHRFALRTYDYGVIELLPIGPAAPADAKTVSFAFTAPTTPGVYRYRLQPLENGIEWFGDERVLELTIDPVRAADAPAASASYATWAARMFTAAELADPEISDPDAIYGSDGMTNLLKYALGLDPKTDGTEALPQTTTLADHWFYTYHRATSVSDVVYRVEVSTDLTNWSEAGVTQEIMLSDSAWQTWQAQYHAVPGQTVYFRLNLSLR
jgi:hypothetical protein